MTFDLTRLAVATGDTAQLTGTLHILDRELAIDTPVTLTALAGGGLRVIAEFEIDHRAVGFAFKMLPRRVWIEASITLEPDTT